MNQNLSNIKKCPSVRTILYISPFHDIIIIKRNISIKENENMFEKILKYYAGCITMIANRCSVFRYPGRRRYIIVSDKKKYYMLIIRLLLKNETKLKEIYYLLVGFLGD